MEYLFPGAGKVFRSKVFLQHFHVLKTEMVVGQPGGFGAGFAPNVGSEILGAPGAAPSSCRDKSKHSRMAQVSFIKINKLLSNKATASISYPGLYTAFFFSWENGNIEPKSAL